MTRRRIRIVTRRCPRCGVETSGTDRPIHGSTALHAQFAGLCSDCVTPEEREEMLRGIGASIIRKAGS